ncbi:MAG: PspC domain-containing protein [Lachnospiraceae bacterium]|nr:PspC domain-containing protein [Lachnospiraceae bacterium]
MLQRRITRSATDKMIAGVCGGLGNYMGVDPTFIRIAWALACLLAGTGLLAYVICALIIPSETAISPYE